MTRAELRKIILEELSDTCCQTLSGHDEIAEKIIERLNNERESNRKESSDRSD